MKHNWEYKKLGDVCTVVGGGTPKTEVEEFWNGNLNWFTPAEIDGRKYYAESERKITPDAVKSSSLTLLPIGTVLLTSRAPIGKIGILKQEGYCNQGFKNLICKECLYNEYLYYAISYFNEDIKEKGRGSTFKEISKKITESIEIPVPPMEVQQQIVAELDKINEIISDCKKAICNLDNLAQSLFFDYFGDPITNPKAWETLKISECCTDLYAGGDRPKDTTPEMTEENQIPVYSNGISKEGLYGYTSKARTFAPAITISGRGTIGVPFIRRLPFFPVIRLIVIILDLNIIGIQYLYHIILYLNLGGNGAAIPQLTVPMVKDISLPVPPLELQEKFEARIEQIEEQKRGLEATISEMQTLLDSRMDYWFN